MHRIGTSGWTYDDWQGPFYPAGISGSKRLSYYASQFGTVEVNATFYRYPSATMIAAWNRQLPKGFALSLKASRRLTQTTALPSEALMQLFLERATQLEHARVVLWQWSPTRHFDRAWLKDFMRLIERHSPKRLRHALEFRHDSFWTQACYDALAERRMAFVCVSHPSLPSTWQQTTDFAYVRLHGLDAQEKYLYDYSPRALSVWLKRLRAMPQGQDSYVFFNNDRKGFAIKNAQALQSRLARLGKA